MPIVTSKVSPHSAGWDRLMRSASRAADDRDRRPARRPAERQPDAEGGARALLALDLDRAAVGLDDGLGDAQARARRRRSCRGSRWRRGRSAGRGSRARPRGSRRPCRPPRSSPGPRRRARRRTSTRPPVGVNLSAFETRLSSTCASRSGVAQQRAAATRPGQRQRDPRALGVGQRRLDRLLGQRPEVDRPRGVQRELAGLEPGDEEQVAHQAQQAVRVALDHLRASGARTGRAPRPRAPPRGSR